MSYSTDFYAQEDTCTFPVYQRLRKLNPYAYYSLDAQKQMQQDLREAGSLVFFEQDEDTLPEPDEAVGLISLTDALSEADQMIETGDSGFHDRAEIALGVLYATDTLPGLWTTWTWSHPEACRANSSVSVTSSTFMLVHNFHETM